MLTPANFSSPLTKSSSAGADTQNDQQLSTNRDSSTPGENGPSRIQPETNVAIDPTRGATKSERLRSLSSNGQDPRETMPAGPPPAFIETLLERQAREGFTKMNEPSSTEAVPATLTQEVREAKAGFEAGREATKLVASSTTVDSRR